MGARYAVYKRGEISKTKGQVKKHRTQCSNNELKFVAILIKSLGSIKLSKHAKLKTDITINMDDIKNTLRATNLQDLIIEYNVSEDDKRVLIRSDKAYKTIVDDREGYSNLCFVLSLLTKEVITVFYNDKDDKHDSLNPRRYNKNLTIC